MNFEELIKKLEQNKFLKYILEDNELKEHIQYMCENDYAYYIALLVDKVIVEEDVNTFCWNVFNSIYININVPNYSKYINKNIYEEYSILYNNGKLRTFKVINKILDVLSTEERNKRCKSYYRYCERKKR